MPTPALPTAPYAGSYPVYFVAVAQGAAGQYVNRTLAAGAGAAEAFDNAHSASYAFPCADATGSGEVAPTATYGDGTTAAGPLAGLPDGDYRLRWLEKRGAGYDVVSDGRTNDTQFWETDGSCLAGAWYDRLTLDKLDTALAADPANPGKYRWTDASLALAPSGSGGSGLSGPSSVTLMFHDADGNPVPNVDFTIVGKGPGTADGSGVAAFGLDDGTYTVVAEATNGTLFANATLRVSGTTAKTITGTAVTVDPASAGQTTGYLTTLDGEGNPASGVTVKFRMASKGTAGLAWDRTPFTATSGANGLLQVTLAQSTTYQAKRGEGQWATFTTGTDATYQLPEVLSEDWDT